MIPTIRGRATLMPLDSLFGMRREMDRLLGHTGEEGWGDGAQWSMPTDVVERDDRLEFRMEIPGLNPDDIDVTVESHVLTVTGEKRHEREEGEQDGDYRIFERRYGRFQRSFSLPTNVQADSCHASYRDGVLTLRFDKREEARPRRIQVEAGQDAQQRIERGSGEGADK